MAKTDRFAIDEARKLQNLPPLTDDEFASLEGNGASDEEKEAQKLEAKKKLDDEAAAKLSEEEKLNLEKEKNTAAPTPQLSDDEVLKIVSERTGRTISSYDDLKPAQEIVDKEKVAEEREADKLSWAFKNKKVKQKEYEAFIADSKNPKDLVLAQYRAEALKEDASLTDAEIEEEFDQRFNITDDKTSRAYKRGQKELNLLAENILKNNYANIYNLESDYSAFEKNQATEKSVLQKVKEGAPAFFKTVDDAMAKLKKIKVQLSENDEYEVDGVEESLTEINSMLRDPSFVAQQIQKGYRPEDIGEIAYTTFLRKSFPELAKKIVNQALLKHAAGTRGIPKIGINTGSEETVELSPEQQTFVNIHKAANAKEAAAN